MFLGLCVPAGTAVLTVLLSKSKALKSDLKRKLIGFYRVHPVNLFSAFTLFVCIVAVSILLSVFFGQSLDQFSFAEGFSFSIKGSSALLTILLASVIEELGWRGYGEDAIAQYGSWFWESVLFGFIWSGLAYPTVFHRRVLSGWTSAAWYRLCNKFLYQCNPSGIYYDVGVRKE